MYEKITKITDTSFEGSTVCELCDYQSSSSTVLKAHKIQKHKYEQKVLEQLTNEPLDISLEVTSSSCTLN